MTRPRVALVANTFGLGPAGKAFNLLEVMQKRFDADWMFLGRKNAMSIGNLEGIASFEVDER